MNSSSVHLGIVFPSFQFLITAILTKYEHIVKHLIPVHKYSHANTAHWFSLCLPWKPCLSNLKGGSFSSFYSNVEFCRCFRLCEFSGLMQELGVLNELKEVPHLFCARHCVSHWLHTDWSLVCTNGARHCVLDVFQQSHFQTPPIISLVVYSLSIVASIMWIQNCPRFISHAQEKAPINYPPFNYFL